MHYSKSRLMLSALCGMAGLVAAAQALGADTFDGVYTGR